jgi:hypothetical protein
MRTETRGLLYASIWFTVSTDGIKKKRLDSTDYLIHTQKLSVETHFLIFYIFLLLSYRSSFPNRHTSKCGERNKTNTPGIMNTALYPPDKNESNITHILHIITSCERRPTDVKKKKATQETRVIFQHLPRGRGTEMEKI